MAAFVPRQKLWLEEDGKIVMSDYRLRLLEIVADSGSLAQAANELSLSYRRAWGKVKELEANLGFPLVQSAVGGAGGGHTSLTAEGKALIAGYRRFKQRMDDALRQAYAEEIAPVAGDAGRPAEEPAARE